MPRKPQLNIRLDEQAKVAWKAFADEYAQGRIAKLIKDSVEIVMRNPALLDPTKETTQILRDLERGYQEDYADQKETTDKIRELDGRTTEIERKIDLLLNHFDISVTKKTLGDLIDEEE